MIKLVFTLVGLSLIIAGVLLGRYWPTKISTPTNLPIFEKLSLTPKAGIPENLLSVKVTRVVDGDTIAVENNQTVRYIGIDTPETVDPRRSVECFGKEASNKNKELVEGKLIKLEKDVSETDRFGRLLRYVYVDGIFVNDYLARNGYAHASSFPPDVKYQNQFLQAEKEARENKRGLWADDACSRPTIQSDCMIKGNISSKGEKIYHLPGQKYYDKTSIDETAGERWFCSEEEAANSGWRKSKI